ncbi:pilus assembly protein [Vibrio sp. S4M6]|uniref:TadE family protein n=1 Tax=Vibrio sinus TaxID=2946865 RepID=UPI00202A4CBF|nr:TadE family protein [Vibrio sinus]MCL9781276.1 pilus assembly protein [Vibrio sinus]
MENIIRRKPPVINAQLNRAETNQNPAYLHRPSLLTVQTRGVSSPLSIKRKALFGGTIVEFSIVANVFFLTLMTAIDLAYFGYVKLTMQHAVREGARYAITGRADLDPEGNGDRSAAILEKISDASNGYLSKVASNEDIRVEDIHGNNVTGFGDAGDIVAIHIDCTWPTGSPFIYPLVTDGYYNFTVSAAMRNEAF